MLEDFSAPNRKVCIGQWCSDAHKPSSGTVATDVRFCKRCYGKLKNQLSDLPRIYNSLAQVMLPSPQRLFQRIRGSRGASGIRFDEDASSGRSEILVFLRSWSALVADECSDECSVRKPMSGDCNSLTSFLLEHFDWLLAHPAASDFEEELSALIMRSRQIADSAPAQLNIGRCVRPGCDARLFAISASNGKPEIHCGAGHAWQANQWLQLYRQLQGA